MSSPAASSALASTSRYHVTLPKVYREMLGRRVDKHNRTNWDYHIFPLGGRTIAKFNNAPDTLFVHADALGSSTFVMDHFGNPLQDQTFYPWGTTWNAVPNSVDGTFASIIPRDLGVDLFLTPNRDYSSNQGRWLRPDPLAGILRIRSPSTDMRTC